MDESGDPPAIADRTIADRTIADLADAVETFVDVDVAATLAGDETGTVEERKRTLQALRDLAADRPDAFGASLPALAPLLAAAERPVRLTTAKLFVAVAAGAPETVVPAVPALADRLADPDEFYYVRARSAEALGSVALDAPDVVASPETLADLRVGLSFDEPEVREKLAKALECVALGDPRRLGHQVSSLADHLDDDAELVRYHLSTALAAVGTALPTALADARAPLVGRLDDGSPHVRGRAAEALGLLARAAGEGTALPAQALESARDEGDGDTGDDEAVDDGRRFVASRVRFALAARDGGAAETDSPDAVGTAAGIRATTADAVEAITAPDGECPHCGLALPEGGPPMCPRCGAPH